jgi:hypothetical protein
MEVFLHKSSRECFEKNEEFGGRNTQGMMFLKNAPHKNFMEL